MVDTLLPPALEVFPTHINKLLNQIGNSISAIESFNTANLHIRHQIDLAARLDILKKRMDTLEDECKEHLWDATKRKRFTKAALTGERYMAELLVIDCLRFATKDFAEHHPKLYKQFLKDTTMRRTTFKARGM